MAANEALLPEDDSSQEVDDLVDATVEDFDPSKAVARMEKAIARGMPGLRRSSVYMVLGTRYEDLEDLEKALESYTKSLAYVGRSPITLFWRGQIYYRRGDLDNAQVDFEQALAFDPPEKLDDADASAARTFLAEISARRGGGGAT